MKMYYSYNEMKRAFECGRNFQLTGENNFQELLEELNQELLQADVSGRSGLLCDFFEADNKTSSATKCKCGREKWEHPKAT
jgi:hypothetical protein